MEAKDELIDLNSMGTYFKVTWLDPVWIDSLDDLDLTYWECQWLRGLSAVQGMILVGIPSAGIAALLHREWVFFLGLGFSAFVAPFLFRRLYRKLMVKKAENPIFRQN